MHLGNIDLLQMMNTMMRTYEELITFSTFDERFKYLKLNESIGNETFGFDRWLNQVFYRSYEWRKIRREVIIRDCGYDLGCESHPISSQPLIIHHMNPISIDDIKNRSEILLNPNYLITTIDSTHKAIHFGDCSYLNRSKVIERYQNDTCPWRNC